MAASLPDHIGRYEVLARLASGGMAEILLARVVGPSGFERPVVIKRILPHCAEEPAFRTMFLDEARIAAGIQHPNVVQHFDLGEEDGELFLVMEYLDGESLSNVRRRACGRGLPLGHDVAAHIMAEACAGLHAAHELVSPDGTPQELVHRDVSPQNIFVTYDALVKVLDFGIAKAADRSTRTETGTIKGKFQYLSPEQGRGEPLDRRSDVFALGIVLFELLSGHRLFKRSTSAATLRAVLEAEIPSPRELDPECPESLARVCLRALERDPSQRFATAREMRQAILGAAKAPSVSPLPEDRLRSRMAQLFEQRIVEKRELARRVRERQPITSVPPPDIDSAPELPTVEGRLGTAAPPAPGSGRRWFTLSIAVAASALLAAVAIVWSGGARSATPGDGPTHVVDRNEEPESVEEIEVTVESSPSEARLSIEGTDHGLTPVTVRLPVSEVPRHALLELDDHASQRFELAPDRDQSFSLALEPNPPVRSEPARGRAPPRRRGQPSLPPEPSVDWPSTRF